MVNDRLVTNVREIRRCNTGCTSKKKKKKTIKQTKTQYNKIQKTKQKWALRVLNVYVFCQFRSIRVRVVVFNATFNNISVISWRSVSLVEKTADLSQVTEKTFSHNVVTNAHHHEQNLHSKHQWWYALIAQIVVYPSTILSPASVLTSSYI